MKENTSIIEDVFLTFEKLKEFFVDLYIAFIEMQTKAIVYATVWIENNLEDKRNHDDTPFEWLLKNDLKIAHS